MERLHSLLFILEVHENVPTSQDELFQEANDSQFEMDNEVHVHCVSCAYLAKAIILQKLHMYIYICTLHLGICALCTLHVGTCTCTLCIVYMHITFRYMYMYICTLHLGTCTCTLCNCVHYIYSVHVGTCTCALCIVYMHVTFRYMYIVHCVHYI